MEQLLTEEFQQEDFILEKSNNLQIKIAERLGISMEEYATYYSELTRSFLNRHIYKLNPTMLQTERLWSWIEDTLYTHIVRHFFAGKVDKIITN